MSTLPTFSNIISQLNNSINTSQKSQIDTVKQVIKNISNGIFDTPIEITNLVIKLLNNFVNNPNSVNINTLISSISGLSSTRSPIKLSLITANVSQNPLSLNDILNIIQNIIKTIQSTGNTTAAVTSLNNLSNSITSNGISGVSKELSTSLVTSLQSIVSGVNSPNSPSGILQSSIGSPTTGNPQGVIDILQSVEIAIQALQGGVVFYSFPIFISNTDGINPIMPSTTPDFAGQKGYQIPTNISSPNIVIPTFLEAVLTYVNTLYPNLIDSSFVKSLQNGNFTSSTKISSSNPNQTITTILINDKNIVLYIIKDLLTNNYFFELPNILNLDGSKEQSSIAYNVQNDGSINGKFRLANGQEIPFTIHASNIYPNTFFPMTEEENNVNINTTSGLQ
jgi:hypothetical protein